MSTRDFSPYQSSYGNWVYQPNIWTNGWQPPWWEQPFTKTTDGTSTGEYSLKGSGWECPRCHQIWAYWAMKCDCQPEPVKCILCRKPSDFMDQAGYGSQHDGDPVCGECLARLIDDEYKRLHGDE